MIKRIAMWKLKPECDKNDLIAMGQMLESLSSKIEGISSLEVGINVSTSNSRCDIVFTATFLDADALKVFEEHPYHLEVGRFVDRLKYQRHVVDYIV